MRTQHNKGLSCSDVFERQVRSQCALIRSGSQEAPCVALRYLVRNEVQFDLPQGVPPLPILRRFLGLGGNGWLFPRK